MKTHHISGFIFITAFVLTILASGAVAASKEPSKLDFAYGIHLEISGADALYETDIPLDVYRGVTSGDLRDLCVFNSRGEVVPFSLFRAETRAAPEEKRRLPLFPLKGDPDGQLAGLSLSVKKDPSGSIISVKTADGNRSDQRVLAYLLDASHLTDPVSALELELVGKEGGILRKITVETSSDLQHWNTAVPGAAVARLRYGHHTLERTAIDLGGIKAPYFRLSSRDAGPMPEISAAFAKMAAGVMESPHQWIPVPATRKRRNGVEEYRFDTTGRMPVDRIRVQLPQENTIVKATFLSRAERNGPWIERGSFLLYNLRLGGDSIKSHDPAFPSTSDRYWLMRVDSTGGGLGEGIPNLEFGWVPEKLVFVARGSGPFTLAYGSATADFPSGQGSELLQRLKDLKKEYTATKITATGTRLTLGGETRLRREMTPQDWKTAILWTTLILGVALIAWMAVSLYRQLQ